MVAHSKTQSQRRQAVPAAPVHDLSCELRDGLLQDLVALGMLATTLRRRIDGVEIDERLTGLLETLDRSLSRDAEQLRALISRLDSDAA